LFVENTWSGCGDNRAIWVQGQRYDPTTESQFVWKIQHYAGHNLGVHEMNYTNWLSGEPNNYRGNESCISVVTTSGNKWNDENCDQELCFVCDSHIQLPIFRKWCAVSCNMERDSGCR